MNATGFSLLRRVFNKSTHVTAKSLAPRIHIEFLGKDILSQCRLHILAYIGRVGIAGYIVGAYSVLRTCTTLNQLAAFSLFSIYNCGP